MFALFVMAGLYTVLAPQTVSLADPNTTTQVDEGRKLFAVGCASCHGLNGQGSSQGPTLVGVGAASVDFQVSTGRMPLANPEQQAPRKTNRYTDAEVAAMAAFVASLGPGPGIPDPASYEGSGLSERDIARGGELFRTNCSACHNFQGAGGALPNGKYAPSLFGVDNRFLYEAMLTGPQQMPVFSDQVLRPEDKAAIIAYLNQLHNQPNQGGLSLGSLGPVSEGLWAWIAGLAVVVAFAVWIAAKGAKAR